MSNPPKTLEEARDYNYGYIWENIKYKEGYCAWEVLSGWKIFSPYQCTRKNGYGPGRLYCKKHAKKIKDK